MPSVPFVLVLLFGLNAWSNRFVCDDAFISMRFARNLAAGRGLVWNPGEYVQGFSNPLWTLLLAAVHAVGLDPVDFVYAVGPLTLVAALLLAWRLASRLAGPTAASTTLVLLGTNTTFSSFATSGLETMPTTLLGIAVLLVTVDAIEDDAWTRARLAALGALGAASALLRADGWLVIAAPALAALLVQRPGTNVTFRERATRALRVALPTVIAVLAWTTFAWCYYGDPVPNPVRVKTADVPQVMEGLQYLSGFLTAYWLWPFPVLVAAALLARPRLPWGAVHVVAAAVTLHVAFVVVMGGDFMEYRMMVPALPGLVALTTWSVVRLWGDAPAGLTVVVVVALGGVIHHDLLFQDISKVLSLQSIPQMRLTLDPKLGWDRIGRALGAPFADKDAVLLATLGAGIVPYTSGLRGLDLFGLCDREIALGPSQADAWRGHNKLGTLALCLRRRVNLLGGHLLSGTSLDDPLPQQGGSYARLVCVPPDAPLPRDACMLKVPVEPGRVVYVLYLCPRPDLDAAIDRAGWVRVPIFSSQPPTASPPRAP